MEGVVTWAHKLAFYLDKKKINPLSIPLGKCEEKANKPLHCVLFMFEAAWQLFGNQGCINTALQKPHQCLWTIFSVSE